MQLLKLLGAAASGEKSLALHGGLSGVNRTSEPEHQSQQRAFSGEATPHAWIIKKENAEEEILQDAFLEGQKIYILLIRSKTSTPSRRNLGSEVNALIRDR